MGNSRTKILWFLFGLGGQLQILASLSITELLVLLIFPFVVFGEIREMKKDGVMTLFVLSLMVNVGCIIASLVNRTEIAFALRGFAATVVISCSVVVGHWLIRKDILGYRWMLLGGVISGFLCLFVFQKQVEVVMLGQSVDDIMRGPIFWISRLQPLVLLPIAGWYLKTPIVYSIAAPILFALFALAISTSGRSSAIALLAMSAIVLIGRKKIKSMKFFSRHFYALVAIAAVSVMILTALYGIAAKHGVFGDKFTDKYEQQTREGSSALKLLMAGRGESFAGLLACFDHPLVGLGPWAMDEKGYYEEYLRRHGAHEDYERYIKMRLNHFLVSIRELPNIPVHSHITVFWLWYGILGLIFVLYAVFVIVRFVKEDSAAMPHWFGWLMCRTPGMMWSLLFSALSARFGMPLFLVACLIARAVRQGRFQLPYNIVKEIQDANRK